MMIRCALFLLCFSVSFSVMGLEVTKVELDQENLHLLNVLDGARQMPLAPGNGLVLFNERMLKWIDANANVLHEGEVGKIDDLSPVVHAGEGFAYRTKDSEVLIVGREGVLARFADLQDPYLHLDRNNTLAALSHLEDGNRVLRVLTRDGDDLDAWVIQEERYPMLDTAGRFIVIKTNPLSYVNVEQHHHDMHASDHCRIVKGGKVIWRSEEHKWSFVGVLPDGRILLQSRKSEGGTVAVVDTDGALVETITLGKDAVVYYHEDAKAVRSVVLVGDRDPDDTYRFRVFSPDGELLHDFSRFGTIGHPVSGTDQVIIPKREHNALVDPFSGQVLWSNQMQHFFVREGERTKAYRIAAQSGTVSFLVMLADDNKRVRAQPAADRAPVTVSVEGSGRWRFLGYRGSTWLISYSSLYEIRW